ncbi:SDR family oxidoreductase [uncultured Paludibaculum sp.]|uniref:SDR family NAD(P)-dependent oxidoreductase n=1 Tax=uncultured Paludibaculum sp. TaxID=1765020 RepID=UPI002AAA6B60|nr:SDR family oxidoreductase [uncultured Paludibaculum sp.]
MTAYPNFDLTGRTALVTGAARGLGRAIALALAHAGADVALGLREVSSGGALASEIEAMGRRAVPLQMDVSSLQQIRQAVDDAATAFGRLDVLVNNVGMAEVNPAELVSEEEYDRQFALNVKSAYFASQAASLAMMRQGGGSIVTLSSQAGFVTLPGVSVYCMTKAALVHMTKCLAVEWGSHNIRVNAVAPTFIATPGNAEVLADPVFRADVVERIAALHRIGEPMEVAGAVVFLASEAASMITGHTMLIDGGWTAR